MLDIPIPILPDLTLNIPKNLLKAGLLRETDLLVWDETPMQDRFCVEAFDRCLRDLRNEPDRQFGGLTVVFGGDFQQIPPVIVHGTRPQIVAQSLRRSHLWNSLTILRLRQNMRVSAGEQDWMQWLLETGYGRNTNPTSADIVVPPAILTPSLDQLIREIYPNINQPQQADYFLHRTILATHNDSVDALNKILLDKLPGQSQVFWSADSAEHPPGDDGADVEAYTSDFLQSLTISGLPQARLELKLGAPVMVLRNLDPANGLCNGTRGIVTNLSRRVVEISIIGGKFHGQRHFIPRITLNPSNSTLPFVLKCRQFPLRLAFSMTINKSQGQSVQTVGLDLRRPVFGHGQFYVAMSCCTSQSRIRVLLPDDADGKTKNYVWPELLLPQV
jgi:hypothetical protein